MFYLFFSLSVFGQRCEEEKEALSQVISLLLLLLLLLCDYDYFVYIVDGFFVKGFCPYFRNCFAPEKRNGHTHTHN